MKKEFGVRQVGFFVSKFIVEDNGFYYKNKRYAWDDVVAIKRDDDLFARLMRCPSSTILVSDGNIIIVPVTLTERSIKTKGGSNLNQHGNPQYDGFIKLLEGKAPHCKNSKFAKYLYSGNYVMFCRWSIVMSAIFVIFILSVIFILNVKLSYPLKLFIFSTAWSMAIGIIMLVRRRLHVSTILKKLANYKKTV